MPENLLDDSSTSQAGKFDTVSVIIPCHQEARNLKILLPTVLQIAPGAEIIIIDDGSTDDTAEICREHKVTLVCQPYRIGNGAAVKKGAMCATGSTLVLMDGDGQHSPSDIPRLLRQLDEGFDMVVGARDGASHASRSRRVANRLYNRLASYMTGHRIADLTSGFRVVRTDNFREFLYLLPNGFSYPTTITMAFFRAGFPVDYVPIKTAKRCGKSHIRIFRDGSRFLLIILKIGTLFSPMRLFIPVSVTLFLTGIGYYAYTFLAFHRFTNMSALLLVSSLLTFLIGIVAEQVSSLHYKGINGDSHRDKLT